MGHPEPFDLRYVAIGNEDCGKKNYRGMHYISCLFLLNFVSVIQATIYQVIIQHAVCFVSRKFLIDYICDLRHFYFFLIRKLPQILRCY